MSRFPLGWWYGGISWMVGVPHRLLPQPFSSCGWLSWWSLPTTSSTTKPSKWSRWQSPIATSSSSSYYPSTNVIDWRHQTPFCPINLLPCVTVGPMWLSTPMVTIVITFCWSIVVLTMGCKYNNRSHLSQGQRVFLQNNHVASMYGTNFPKIRWKHITYDVYHPFDEKLFNSKMLLGESMVKSTK
jgi:hypothetical protein